MESIWSVKLTTQLHLVPKLRLCGTNPTKMRHFFFCYPPQIIINYRQGCGTLLQGDCEVNTSHSMPVSLE